MVKKSFLFIYFLLVFSPVLLTISCSPEDDGATATLPSADAQETCLASGDILVTNSGSDALVVFNADGTFKRIAYYVSSATENLYGVTWSEHSQEVFVAVDGVDRVVGINPLDCSTRDVIVNLNLTGNIRDLTQLNDSHDILVVETNNIERFGANGNRVVSGWPLVAQTGGTGISKLEAGGFVHCSLTADVVRTYTANGAMVATRSSGIAATTDATGCIELSSGRIAVAWSGTSDTVAIYSANLVDNLANFSNTAHLAAPGGLVERDNGNILVVDRIYNTIIEISPTGAFVGTFGAGYLSTPEFITVIP